MTILSPKFEIGSIRIGIVEGASCINFGNNLPTGFESYKKHNQGLGTISGDSNTMEGLRSLLRDAAALDTFVSRDGVEVPDWIQQWIEQKLKQGE